MSIKLRLEYAGTWAMRGPQSRLHFYRTFQGMFSHKAICGVEDPSFIYSQSMEPREDQVCKRCWRQRGNRP